MQSKAYELYKEAVGGKTFNGDDMKELSELPEAVQNAWLSIDKHYTQKKTVESSKVYDEYKGKNKDVKDFIELPESLKKSWANLDKNYDKLLKPKKEVKPKVVKEVKPKVVKTGLVGAVGVF